MFYSFTDAFPAVLLDELLGIMGSLCAQFIKMHTASMQKDLQKGLRVLGIMAVSPFPTLVYNVLHAGG